MNDAIVVFNAGSSSIKFALYDLSKGIDTPEFTGKIFNIGQQPTLKVTDRLGKDLSDNMLKTFDETTSHEVLTEWLLQWFDERAQSYKLKGIGHRIVHGGRDFVAPTLINKKVMALLTELTPLAPMHQPHNLSAINAVLKWAPALPQVGCFDTSFHRTQDKLAQMFALPRELNDQGVIKYGFHGISYEYIANCLPEHIGELSSGRVVVAHLGNGASMCAMKNRKSVATSMGFTALDGLMMGQRCGTLDAGVVLHLLTQNKMSIEQVQHLLYHESGLLGVSGISNNMQILEKSEDPHAKQAIELFCYRASCELASLANTIKGLDVIVFTAGIGENSVLVREKICEHLSWLNIRLDKDANKASQKLISHPKSAVKVLVIRTNEELVIAKATHKIIQSL